MIICWRRSSSPVAWLRASLLFLTVLVSACATKPPTPLPTPQPAPPRPAPVPPSPPTPVPTPTPQASLPGLKAVSWRALPNWQTTPLLESWGAFLQGCTALQKKAAWHNVCDEARRLNGTDETALHDFFERNFQAYESANEDGTTEGLVTGYYEPLIQGSRTQTTRARFPIYGVPDDLITVDLASVYPELKNLRLRGKLVGNKVVPYATRSEIEGIQNITAKAKVLAWAEDAFNFAARGVGHDFIAYQFAA